MSDLSVPRTSPPTSLPSAPSRSRSLASVAAPSKTESPAVQRSASQPQLFKTPTAAADPSSEAQSKIESTPSSTVGQNQQLMQASRDAIMQDVPAESASASAPAGPSLEQSMNTLQSCFDSSVVDFTRKADGSPDIVPAKLLMATHNPLASTAAKKEAEFFRFFCKTEFSSENTHFFDKVHALSKTDPHSPEFDTQLSHLHNFHLRAVGASEQVNIPWDNRNQLAAQYSQLQTAQQNMETTPSPENKQALIEARAKMVAGVSEAMKEVNSLMRDTFRRFEPVSADTHKLYNKSIVSLSAHEYKKENLARMRGDQMKKNLKLYDNFKKSLKDPNWEETARIAQRRKERVTQNIIRESGARPGTLKFGLYNTFVRPWKSW